MRLAVLSTLVTINTTPLRAAASPTPTNRGGAGGTGGAAGAADGGVPAEPEPPPGRGGACCCVGRLVGSAGFMGTATSPRGVTVGGAGTRVAVRKCVGVAKGVRVIVGVWVGSGVPGVGVLVGVDVAVSRGGMV